MHHLLPRRRRSGVSLLEIAIVLAIVGIMAALAGTLLSNTLPSWRTRRAAREFSAALNQCRQMAIVQGVQYRIRLSSYDSDLDGTSANVGVYFIERGNSSSGSTVWDILPWDLDGSGTQTGEGTVEISDGGLDELPGVSIENWGSLAGVDGNDIVFNPRGWLDNPVSDFTDGYISVTFVNKRGRSRGDQDEWAVQVSRGGLVRMQSNKVDPVGVAPGTTQASGWMTTSSTGHAP